MKRILDLQKMEQPSTNVVLGGPSTSSRRHCTCSTHSNTGCTPQQEFIVI